MLLNVLQNDMRWFNSSRTGRSFVFVRNSLLDLELLKVLNDKHLYHFVDMKPTHPSTRKKRDVIQEEFIQRHELVSI